MTTHAPTGEQQAAVDLFSRGESLAIEAGAGTGKTSTLILIAKAAAEQQRRGQYVAFNKAIVTEASAKFGANVRCNTAHSLAFREIGKKYAHRLGANRMKSIELANRLGLDAIAITVQDGTHKTLHRTYLAGLVMRSVEQFCQSADPEPTHRHVPYINGIDVPPGKYDNNRQVAKQLVPAIRRAWADLLNPDGQLPYRHSHYLKAWQLSNPRIDAEFILFDEAQDANPVMVAIVAAQAGRAQLVWVGDSQQQIYSFTGAVNALASVPADQRAFLTRSFRFGPTIAAVANRCLDSLDAELRLVGSDNVSSTVGPVDDPDVILTRTNAAAVRAVLAAQGEGKRTHLVGGGDEIVRFAKAAQELIDGGRTAHPELACFESWDEVRQYVEEDEQGGDLKLMVSLIDEFSIPTILAALDNMVREDRADLVVSTAHKSKGREWDKVKLGDDFAADAKDEELRLLYVAATRAKLRLDHTNVGWFTLDDNTDADEAVDHDAADHDAADCPDCIRRSRQAEHDAEGEHTNGWQPDRPAPSSFDVYVDGRDPYKVPALVAVDHARSVYQRTGQRVTVCDGSDLIVEFDR